MDAYKVLTGTNVVPTGYVSSNPAIADVESGTSKIAAKQPGNCTITVTVGGVSYECNVSVSEK